jgi:predicted phage tail protein
MLRKIKLYGELAEKYGKEWEFDIETPGEAIKALCANNPGFKQFMAESDSRNTGYQVVVGETYIEDPTELNMRTSKDTIKIIPTILGSKSAWGRIIIGVVIIVVTCLYAGCSGAGGAVSIMQGAAGWGAAIAMTIGVNLVVSGVTELIVGVPKRPEAEYADNNNGFGFSGSTNTVKQGIAIPVCYGQLMVGGAVISASILNEDYVQ